MTLMRHGDYVARVTYDEEIDSFFGEVINTSDVITFYGRSVEELKREMATSIEVLLEACRAKGVEPSRPYSGRFNRSPFASRTCTRRRARPRPPARA